MTGDHQKSERRARAALDHLGIATVKEVAEVSGLSYSCAYNCLQDLIALGQATRKKAEHSHGGRNSDIYISAGERDEEGAIG